MGSFVIITERKRNINTHIHTKAETQSEKSFFPVFSTPSPWESVTSTIGMQQWWKGMFSSDTVTPVCWRGHWWLTQNECRVPGRLHESWCATQPTTEQSSARDTQHNNMLQFIACLAWLKKAKTSVTEVTKSESSSGETQQWNPVVTGSPQRDVRHKPCECVCHLLTCCSIGAQGKAVYYKG